MASKKGKLPLAPIDPLHLSEQTIETLHDPAYWRKCCPFLTCFRDSAAEAALAEAAEAALVAANLAAAAAVSEAAAAAAVLLAGAVAQPIEVVVAVNEAAAATAALAACEVAAAAATVAAIELTASLKARLRDFGFFKLTADKLRLDSEVVAALGRGALRLIELGHSPSALLAYDEVWSLSAAANALLVPITGNVPNGDFFTFVVAPGRHEFAGPHRDKPAAGDGPPSFRAPDQSPGFVTAWLALTPATPESSCLTFLPACDDPVYRVAGDALREVRVPRAPEPCCARSALRPPLCRLCRARRPGETS